MSLRQQAAADLVAIVEDTAAGFGWPLTVTSPDGVTASMKGLSTDVGQTIDPQTGMVVVGRRASVALAISSLATAGLGIPRGIADGTSRPWLVTFEDLAGTPQTFKVSAAMPDRAMGVVTCMLEAFKT